MILGEACCRQTASQDQLKYTDRCSKWYVKRSTLKTALFDDALTLVQRSLDSSGPDARRGRSATLHGLLASCVHLRLGWLPSSSAGFSSISASGHAFRPASRRARMEEQAASRSMSSDCAAWRSSSGLCIRFNTQVSLRAMSWPYAASEIDDRPLGAFQRTILCVDGVSAR